MAGSSLWGTSPGSLEIKSLQTPRSSLGKLAQSVVETPLHPLHTCSHAHTHTDAHMPVLEMTHTCTHIQTHTHPILETIHMDTHPILEMIDTHTDAHTLSWKRHTHTSSACTCPIMGTQHHPPHIHTCAVPSVQLHAHPHCDTAGTRGQPTHTVSVVKVASLHPNS